MNYETILVEESVVGLTITFNRPLHKNSINSTFLRELNDALDIAEQNTDSRLVILQGQGGIFCTGMDFEKIASIATSGTSEEVESLSPKQYMATLKRFTMSPKVIISKIDGQVMAGGIGLVAASDFTIASSRSQFSLSEALWGLLPAMVIPYLIRRVGYQKSYRMTLTTFPFTAQEACAMDLVDEISDVPDENIRRLWLRLSQLEESTIVNIKQYFREMWTITEEVEETAISEISKLISSPQIKENIRNYVQYGRFPWQNGDKS